MHCIFECNGNYLTTLYYHKVQRKPKRPRPTAPEVDQSSEVGNAQPEVGQNSQPAAHVTHPEVGLCPKNDITRK